MVYTEFDADKGDEVIKYLSLSEEAEKYRHSQTMTIGRDQRNVGSS